MLLLIDGKGRESETESEQMSLKVKKQTAAAALYEFALKQMEGMQRQLSEAEEADEAQQNTSYMTSTPFPQMPGPATHSEALFLPVYCAASPGGAVPQVRALCKLGPSDSDSEAAEPVELIIFDIPKGKYWKFGSEHSELMNHDTNITISSIEGFVADFKAGKLKAEWMEGMGGGAPGESPGSRGPDNNDSGAGKPSESSSDDAHGPPSQANWYF